MEPRILIESAAAPRQQSPCFAVSIDGNIVAMFYGPNGDLARRRAEAFKAREYATLTGSILIPIRPGL
jgi:hypothetical protein